MTIYHYNYVLTSGIPCSKANSRRAVSPTLVELLVLVDEAPRDADLDPEALEKLPPPLVAELVVLLLVKENFINEDFPLPGALSTAEDLSNPGRLLMWFVCLSFSL